MLSGLLSSFFILSFVSYSSSFPKPLSQEDEKKYLELYATGTEEEKQEARNILIEHNLRLVAHIAKKYAGFQKDSEDLISAGTIGLIKAVSSYDASKCIRLATYASRCIENAILSQMRLWFLTNPPRVKKNRNGVFWHRFPKTFISFAPLRAVM